MASVPCAAIIARQQGIARVSGFVNQGTIAMGSIACEHCTAACCRYVAIPLEKPKTAKDYDDMRWDLMHEGVTGFQEEGDWYIQFQTRCKNLGLNCMCQVYDTRPMICREYEAGECDYTGGDYGYEHLFTHPMHVEKFYHDKTGKHLPSVSHLHPPVRKGGKRRKVASTA